MSIRSLSLIALACLAGTAIAQTTSYSSTFGDYQPWRDGAPADWRAVNRTVAAASDAHAGHGSAAPAAAGHDHGTTGGHAHGTAGGHDHGKAGHDMGTMHQKMHGGAKGGHDMQGMPRDMHGGAGGRGQHDMSAMRERMSKPREEMHKQMHGDAKAAGASDHSVHDHGAAAGKKP